jgi:hypothetical protein
MGRGLTAKLVGVFGVELFFNRKIRWTWSTISGPLRVPVHDGLGPSQSKGLAGARPSSHSRARRPTGGGTAERAVYGESISGLTEAREAAWRPRDGGEEVAEEALGVGSAWAQREEMKSGERCSGEWQGSPFI